MRDKKKLLALLLFLIMGFFMFTFANPSDTVGTLTKPVEDPKGGETDKDKDKDKDNEQVVITVDNAPVITVEPKTVSIAFGTDYDVMTGVKVTDDKDNLVATPSIKDTKELEVGTYTITYTVTDSAGHTVTATRTLVVFEDKNNNNLPDEEEEHYDVNFDVEGRGSLEGTTSYAEILTGLTFEEAEIEIPEPVADEYYMFVEWTPVTPTSETVVEETVTYVAVFGPINDVNENGIADEEETYTLTIDYEYSRGGEAAKSYTKDVVYNMPYEVESPVIEYYTASEAVVSGDMPNEDLTVTVVYTPNNDRNQNGIADEKETFTVTFVDYDGKVIATTPVLVNEDATLPANPTRAKKNGISYTFAGWEGNYTNITKDETVKATYEISEIEATVYELTEKEIPTKHPYYTGSTKDYAKLGTVKLVLTDDVIAATEAGKAATVIAYEQENVLPYVAGELPTLEGYTYNWYVVKYESDGWHIDGKKTINEHTLTVTFNYSRGEEAFETVTKTVKYAEEYEVEVPTIEYYTANVTEIKGYMPDADVTVDVVYTPNNDRNENGVADELDPHHTVTFIVRGPGKFASIDRVREFINRDTNEIEMVISEDEKTIVYSSILDGLTYAEWENSEDGQSYICATQGELNAKVSGSWVDADGVRYNNLEEVHSSKTFYIDYFYDRNNNNKDDEEEAKYSVAFEITGKEGAAYFNEARINEALEAGATVATSTKIVYTGIVTGATINKYGYKTPIATAVSGAKCSAWNPDINAVSTPITSDIISTKNCFMDKNGNDKDDDKEERITLTLEVVNGTFTDRAKTYFEGKGANVNDSTITFTDILPGTSYNSLYNNGNYYNTVGLPGTTLTSRPTTPNVATAVAKITEDTTFTWVYSFNEYTVNFYDENDELIESQTVEYGKDAVAPNYTVESTDEFEYVITWDKDLTNVKSNLEVKVVVTPVTRKYNVTFKDYDGSQIGDVQSVEYGSAALAPVDPTRENYTFTGWDTEFTNITGETVVTATYTANQTGIRVSLRTNQFLQFQVGEQPNLVELIKVERVFADGSTQEITDYTASVDTSKVTNGTSLVVVDGEYTDSSLTYTVIEEQSFKSKFEVNYTGKKEYRATKSCDWNFWGTKGTNCDSANNTKSIGTNYTFLEVIEHYDQNIQLNDVSVKYVGENESISLNRTGDVRYTHTTGSFWNGNTFYNPTYIASLKNGQDIMNENRVIDTVTVTYVYDYKQTYTITFKYDASSNEFKATAEDPV